MTLEPVALDYLVVGHVTVDVRPDGGTTPGGTVAYAAAAASALGLRVGVVTRAEVGYPPPETRADTTWHVIPDDTTTTFTNDYDPHGARHQVARALAGPLRPSDIPRAWRRVGVLHLGPVAGEVDAAVGSVVEAQFVGLTAQGWCRRVVPGRPVTLGPCRIPPRLLARADAVVLSDEDLQAAPDGRQRLAAACRLLVVTRGAAGAVAYVDGRSVEQPSFRANETDPTGAGDVFAAALFSRLWQGADLPAALRFAAAAGAFAVERAGVGGLPDRAAIEARASR